MLVTPEVGTRFPLTPRQTLMWMDRKLFPELPLHHIGLGLRLRGALDRGRLETALRQGLAVSDCFALRLDETQPEQWFGPPPEVELEWADLSGSPDEEWPWRGQLTCRRFGPGAQLVRAGLARVRADEHLLVIVFHHVVADGVTAVLLANRVAALYGGSPAQPAPSYRVFLEHHAAYRASQKHADDAAYWSGKLGAGTPPLELYGLPHRDPSLFVAQIPVPDPGSRLAAMAGLARDPRVALVSPVLSRLIAHATLLTAYAHRVTGNREIVVAVPFANRPGVVAQVAGLTMEQLFLKVEVDEGESFSTLAQKVRREVAMAMRHGRYCVSERGVSFVTLNLLAGRLDPFADLALDFDPCESFLYEDQVRGLSASPRNLLSVNIFETGGSTDRLELRMHAGTFPEDTRARARTHYLRLMDAMVADLDGRIAAAPLVDEAERRTLVAFGRGAQPGEPAPDLLDRLASFVERQPSATAVATAATDVSYAELDRRVRRLAADLRARGVGSEDPVCVCLPRSLDELVALLAVLRAGGAYVPVDLAHPAERTRQVVEDAGLRVAVTLRAHAALFAGIPVIELDDYDWAALPEDAPAPASAPDPARLAYVLFTSGSTGRPKGVEVTRGNLANFLASMAHTPGLGPTDRVLAITTTTFDIAALELFLPLYCGATVELVDRATAADPRLLRRVLERPNHRVSLLQATPATWRLLLDAGFVPDPSLRLLCGGEAMSTALARRLTANGAELWNMYGPTETTVWSSLTRIDRDASSISIGKPIDRTNLYVLGVGGLEPVGTIGEICIGGAGVARGYRGRPDLTAERFQPDPIAADGSRLYHTGDLGRWHADGRLECLGRLDHQVKVRGFRIELGDIEACLRPVPGVSEVLVVARPGPSGEASLVAYWTGVQTDEGPLAARARAHLPSYMHPAAYVHLAELPLNPNGKIDRKLLPDPAATQRETVDVKPPANPMEARLQELWEELLARKPIGVDQSFFDVGGDSILVVSLVARIADAFGIEVPLSRVLEAPTIEQLAESLRATQAGAPLSAASALVQLRPGRDGFFFFVHDGEGETLPYRNLALRLPPGIAVYGIVPRPARGMPMPHATLADLARHYVTEMRRLQPMGPYRLGGLCAGGVIAFEMARQLEAGGERASLLVLIDAAATDARLRFALQTTDRLQRLRTALRTTRAGGQLPWRAAQEIVRRTRNALVYDARERIRRAGVVARHRMLQYVARDGRTWPSWLEPPSVRETCLEMERHHAPGTVRNATVLLVRANGGDGSDADRPLREQFEDPMLGWSRHVERRLEVLDLPAGHSSSLQGESLQRLATRMSELL